MRWHRSLPVDRTGPELPPRKEEAQCCMALVDELGRPPTGFCSPECIRRPENWELVLDGQRIPPGGAVKRRPASTGWWPA